MPTPNLHRPTWAEIDLNRLSFNLESARTFIGRDLKYMAVVKADAYGHGAVECSRRFEAGGIDWLGVALPEEGVELRNAGIRSRILCLGGFWPGQEDLVLDNDLTPVVYRPDLVGPFAAAAERRGVRPNIHVKVDTGMGRVGVPINGVADFANLLKRHPNLEVEGLLTHFASADDLAQNEFTYAQIGKFEEGVRIFRESGFAPKLLDMANSPGAVAHPGSRSDMVRLGGILYGLGGDVLPEGVNKPELRPVLSLITHIGYLKSMAAGARLGYGGTFVTERRSKIATIPIGYADGLPRALSSNGSVLINGSIAPIVGRISMDWTIVDVTDIPEAKEGDRVTVIGEQNGLSIKAEDLAAAANTISYEITCGIGPRVPRRFVE